MRRLLAAIFIATSAHVGLAQTVIRGRVSGANDTPVSGAIVTVLIAGGAPRTVNTEATGAYSVSVPTLDVYSVGVTAVGFAAQRRDVQRAGADTVLANFVLVASVTQLPRVQSIGQRPRPSRSEAGFDNSIGGQVSFPDRAGGLSGDVTGDFAAALSLLPGISVVPDGSGGVAPSIAGVPADQSGMVLNGLSFGGSIPRDGFRAALVTTAYDAGRGGFAGTQVSLRMNSGANLVVRNLHATLDAPALQATTPSARALGSRYSQQVASGQVFGPLVTDRAFYAIAYQFQRRENVVPSLLSADPSVLRSWRASPDSVSHFLSAVSQLGIPSAPPSFSNDRDADEARVAVRLDYSPNPSPTPSLVSPITSVSDDYSMEFGGSWRSTGGAMIWPGSLPSAGGKQSHGDAWLQATLAKYLPRSFLGEGSISLSAGRDRVSPYLALPAARVLVASALDDGSSGVAMYQAGGSSASPSTNSTWSAEARGQLTRLTWDRHHSMALTLDGILDNATIEQDASRGLFTYNSIADLAANRPTTFTRALSARDASANAYQLSLALGDAYSPGPTFRAQYGVRLEDNGILTHAPYNQAVDAAFGRRTDATPTSVAVLPMAGFAWQTLGYIPIPQIANSIARGFVTGGIRRYRGTMLSRLFANTIQQSGTGDALSQLFCVGSATPTPTWTQYAQSPSSIPTQCTAASTTLAESAPPVALVASDYRPMSSWRANVNANVRLPSPAWQATLASTYALNRDLPAAVDLNLSTATRATLPLEANRPIFVPATSIVPASGAVSWAGSRIAPQFSHVSETRSTLASDIGQYSLGLSYAPIDFRQTSSAATITWAFTTGHEQSLGFTGTTAGDPTVRERSTSALPRHTITVSLTRRREDWGTLGLAIRAQSGYRYTPIVGGDINGDGYVNDRAFVFPSTTAGDTALAHGMSRLLAGASSEARDCLTGQAGRIAARNSCAAGWAVPTLNLSLSPDSYRLHLGNRGSVNLYLINVLAGLDQALHGSTTLRGWGQWSSPDPTLLVVRGYDPAASRFIYSVNPLFGSSAVYRSAFRAPFALTVDFKVELGPDRETQLIRGGLRTRAGERADSQSVAAIKAKIDRAVNPFSAIVAQLRDSLKLSQPQVDSIRAIAAKYAMTRDSIVTSLARYLSARRGDYEGDDARDRWHSAAVEITRAGAVRGKEVAAVLSAAQLERLRMQILGLQAVALIDLDPAQAHYTVRGPVAALP